MENVLTLQKCFYLFKGNTNVAYLIFIHKLFNQQQNISGKVKHQAKMDKTGRL